MPEAHRFCGGCGAALPAVARFGEQFGRRGAAIRIQEPAGPRGTANSIARRSRGATARLILGSGFVALAAAGWLQMQRHASHAMSLASPPPGVPVVVAAPAASPSSWDDNVASAAAEPSRQPDPESARTSPAPASPTGVPSFSAAPSSLQPAAVEKEVAELSRWLESQPWVAALKKSMPRGVTVSVDVRPFEADGWSEIEIREHHSPDWGFDPNVSPIVGFFRVSRTGRKVEWMEPVSGDYEPLEGFIKRRGLQDVGRAPALAETTRGKGSLFAVVAGDFQSKPPRLPDRDMPVIMPEPANPGNRVARIIGPHETGFTLPVAVPKDVGNLAVSLRLLHPLSTRLVPFEDGRMPEGIRLRVRLINPLGNSAIRDAVVRPTGQWREMEFVFHDLPMNVGQLSIEAIWMEGPVYVDDVRVSRP